MKNINKEVLNWQVKLIEQGQQDIKVYIKNAVLNNIPFEIIIKETQGIIKAVIDELDSDKLKDSCRQALPQFAYKCYNLSNQAFSGTTLPKLVALYALMRGTADEQQINVLAESTQGVVPLGVDNYTKTVLKTYYKPMYERIQQRLNELIQTNAKEDYRTNVSLRNIAELQVRYDGQLEMLQDIKDKGTRLVWIEPHANCSKRCQPWQGKLYSLDGTEGTADGYRYQPLDNAMNATQTTKSGKVYVNGCITGYNCRHKLKPYYGKDSKPAMIPAKVVENKRAVDEAQRAFERQIRYAKSARDIYTGIDPVKVKLLDYKIKVLIKNYKAFSTQNRVPQARERLKI